MLLMELKQTAASNNDNNNSSLSSYDELAAEFVAAETKSLSQ